MDEHILQNLKNFEAVWQRVSAPLLPNTAPPPSLSLPTQGDTSAIFYRRAVVAARRYERLASLSGGSSAKLLARHAAEERAQARRLRAEYYLQSGKTPTSPKAKTVKLPRTALLREACLFALDSAERFERAAEEAGAEELATLYRRYAEAERRRAAEDRSLLLQCF